MIAPAHIHQWSDHFAGSPSLGAIQQHFTPPSAYRISPFRYPAGTRFSGAMRQGTVFVLQGSCTYDFKGAINLYAGQFAGLPQGEYQFSVIGEEALEIVLVWHLPQWLHPAQE